MNHIKINNTNIACPILKCSISGLEINDASTANAEWAEVVDEKGISKPVGTPISVLRESRAPKVINERLNPHRANNIRIRWMPLDVFLIHQLRNSGVDYDKASREADRLQNLWKPFVEIFIWELIGRGGQSGGSSDPRPPSLKKHFCQKSYKIHHNVPTYINLCRFSHNTLRTTFFMSNPVSNKYLFT